MARGLSQEMRREERRAKRERRKARRRERAQHSQSLQQQSSKLSKETKVKAEEIGHHLDLVAAAGKEFCHKLEAFSCDKHAQGHDLTDAAITRLAMACPNLQTVKLTSTTKLTDESVLAFLTLCPGLHTLSIVGNYPTKGNITGKLAFAELRQNKALGKHLHTLKVVDQRVDEDDAMRLSRARKNLVVWRRYVIFHAGEVVLDYKDLSESESEDESADEGEYEYGDWLTFWDIQDALPEWERWHHW
ncbi:hypothetical protein CLCR_11233 [Cladophialophora carrionii]|uniref:Uncharacterized protein n=1 Tax=Cladophialophora carrionii TaxID=86049 RepID=A0A1C1CB58_9EURO|nr:hypothetical protein CLCR_11233 [Cladophialophora carrionii]